MRTVLWILSIIFLSVIPAFAQGPQLEGSVYGGAPLNHTLREAFCCTTGVGFVFYYPDDAHYVVGLSAGIVLHDQIHVTIGATYMPVSFIRHGTTCCPISNPETTTHGTAWEFPLLADYRWLRGRVRPFSGGGLIVLSHVTEGPNQTPAPVVSGGVEWAHRNFAIRPEIRYIRYPDRSASNIAVQRPANQVQLLIGFTFRKDPP